MLGASSAALEEVEQKLSLAKDVKKKVKPRAHSSMIPKGGLITTNEVLNKTSAHSSLMPKTGTNNDIRNATGAHSSLTRKV